jgi:outer membrane protein OmpA-like peptidoglycan-associated protein/Mg-chelatase subunit ChlD
MIAIAITMIMALFQSCGVMTSVDAARSMDSIYRKGEVEKPRFNIFNADTNDLSNSYRQLKNDYNGFLDSIDYLRRTGPSFDIDNYKAPVPPDSSLFFDVSFIDHSNWPDSVVLGVKVYNHLGESVTGLAPPSIDLERAKSTYWPFLTDKVGSESRYSFDDFNNSALSDCPENSRIISEYTVEEIKKNNSPNHAITYMIDFSGSMGSLRPMMAKLVKKMVLSSKKGDSYAFIPFAGTAYLAQPLTYDLESAKSIPKDKSYLDSIEGGTNIIESLEMAIIETSKSSDTLKRAVVVLTDGFEVASDYDAQAVIEKARENQITIYTIAYGMLQDAELLKSYSESTGGKHYMITNPKEFKFAFADIYLDMSAYYRIAFKPNNCTGEHNVTVGLKMDILDGMTRTATAEYTKAPIIYSRKPVSVNYVDIGFPSGSSVIDEKSMPLIKSMAESLKQKQGILVEIIGHTDNIGNDMDNQELSEKRALAVMDKLIEFGVPKNILKYSGDGENNPVSSNDTEAGRAKNRRTELKIVNTESN